MISEDDIAKFWEHDDLHVKFEGKPLGTRMWVEEQERKRAFDGEVDPFGKSPKEAGSKLDAGKSPVFQGLMDYFPRACLAVANVSAVGAKKYAWKGWETVPDGFNRYSNALGRHLVAESVDGLYDKDTGSLHAAQVAWNALARLELLLKEQQ